MLTTAQIDHYRTFGFVLLPGLLDIDRTSALRAEAGAALQNAYAATSFDPLDAGNGALRFLPGWHDPELSARLTAYRARRQAAGGVGEVDGSAWPGHVAASRPADVLAFDLHTWHASVGGRDRLARTIVDQRCPETGEEQERTCRSMAGVFALPGAGVGW